MRRFDHPTSHVVLPLIQGERAGVQDGELNPNVMAAIILSIGMFVSAALICVFLHSLDQTIDQIHQRGLSGPAILSASRTTVRLLNVAQFLQKVLCHET